MILKSIKIHNFRGLVDYKVAFAPGTNIIIGRNGAGKSTLIDAVTMALSFMFSNNKALGEDFLSAGNPSLNIKSFTDSDYHYNTENRTTSVEASIAAQAIYDNEELSWELFKRSTANASLFTSKYKEAFIKFTNVWKNRKTDLPVIAYFSDSFPHLHTNQTQFALKTIRKDSIPRNFGYYQWDLGTACTSIWEMRMCNTIASMMPFYTKKSRVASALKGLEEESTPDQLKENSEYQELKMQEENINEIFTPMHDEVKFVYDRLSEFSHLLPKLEEEEYCIEEIVPQSTGENYELVIIFKNGTRKTFSELPAGYRRLYSIVLDLAYRAYILNGTKEPCGIVLVDEIDLHLHPSLEQEVVECLRKVFPKLQFIFTSHSAAVIANLDTVSEVEDNADDVMVLFDIPLVEDDSKAINKLLYMQDGQTGAESLTGVYGIDYNSTLRDFMDTPSSSVEIKQLGDKYLYYLSVGLSKEAETVMAKLNKKLGANNKFIAELKEKAKAYEIH